MKLLNGFRIHLVQQQNRTLEKCFEISYALYLILKHKKGMTYAIPSI